VIKNERSCFFEQQTANSKQRIADSKMAKQRAKSKVVPSFLGCLLSAVCCSLLLRKQIDAE